MSGARSLDGRTALVTGASRGIGRAVALALAGAGAAVQALARDAAALEALADADPAGRLRSHPLDLTEDAGLATLARRLEADPGRLDVLVHCAGVIAHAPLAEARVEDLDRQWAANLRAPWLLTRSLLPLLCAGGGGDVVFVNSSVTRHPRAHSGAFAATQHALVGVADALRAELNDAGVRVLSVFPGRTATPRQAALHEQAGADYRPARLLQPEDVAATILHAVTLPRSAEITELHIRPAWKD